MAAKPKKIDMDQTELTLRTCNALASVETRKLSALQIMAKEILQQIDKLDTLGAEKKAASKLKKSQRKPYQEFIGTIKQFKEETGKHYFGLLPEELLVLERILREIKRKKEAVLRKEVAPKPE